MKLQTTEEHYATANKWKTLRTRKQMNSSLHMQKMKYFMQVQTNETHYANAN
jgi:hypothetical protein